MTNLFYTQDRLEKSHPSHFTLEGQEALHAHKVLRIAEGDRIHATDGKGWICSGIVESVSKEFLTAKADKCWFCPPPDPELALAIGLIKKRDRLEFAVEKGVELGVSHILVYRGEHSEKKSVRADRLESAAQSAMKQSLRPWLPSIHICDSLAEVISLGEDGSFGRGENTPFEMMVADKNAYQHVPDRTELGLTPGISLINEPAAGNQFKLFCIVGPEGGFSEKERALMKSREVKPVSLGSYRLRTETAVISIAARVCL